MSYSVGSWHGDRQSWREPSSAAVLTSVWLVVRLESPSTQKAHQIKSLATTTWSRSWPEPPCTVGVVVWELFFLWINVLLRVATNMRYRHTHTLTQTRLLTHAHTWLCGLDGCVDIRPGFGLWFLDFLISCISGRIGLAKSAVYLCIACIFG